MTKNIIPNTAIKSGKVTDYTYMNILINNSTDKPILAKYETTQDLPIVGEIQDFTLSVVRMKIPMSSVPMCKFKEQSYYISFALGQNSDSLTAAQEVIYKPYQADFNTPYPSFVNPNDKVIFYYTDFLEMVNDALFLGWNDLFSNPDYNTILTGYTPFTLPYFQLDSCCKHFELCLPADPTASESNIFYPQNPDGIRIILSSALFSFLNGFPAFYYGEAGLNNISTANYSLNVYARCDKLIQLPACNGEAEGQYIWKIPQDYSTLYAFQQVSRIILGSSIALVKETVLTADAGGKPRWFEVLTDFEITQDTDKNREYIYYYPDGVPRCHNFKDMGELRYFDLSCIVQFQDLTTSQLVIAPGMEFNAKFMLKRRKINDLYQITDRGGRSTF
jgi:hypothetical protein